MRSFADLDITLPVWVWNVMGRLQWYYNYYDRVKRGIEMVEQDYIMRIIKEMVRAIVKLLFGIDMESPTSELLENKEEKAVIDMLLAMIDEGKLNEAENQLYELCSEDEENELKMALIFYSHMNEKSDKFLAEHDFSRDEIRVGLKAVASRHGLGEMLELFR